MTMVSCWYQLHVPLFAGDTGHYHHSEAASSRAEFNKQIPPVERADNLPPSLLNTGLHKSHWYVISRKVALSQVKTDYSES